MVETQTGQKVIVTGGAGFIGANLVRTADDGAVGRRRRRHRRPVHRQPGQSRWAGRAVRRRFRARCPAARRRVRRSVRDRASRRHTIGAPVSGRTHAQPRGKRHRHGPGARGGPPGRQPPRDHRLVLVGLWREPPAAEERRHAPDADRARTPRASSPPRDTHWHTRTATGSMSCRSGSSTCSGRCNRRRTTTRRSSRRSSVPRSKAGRCTCTATGCRPATSRSSTPCQHPGRRRSREASVQPGPVNLAFGSRISLLGAHRGARACFGRHSRSFTIHHGPGDVRDSQADMTRTRALFPDIVAGPADRRAAGHGDLDGRHALPIQAVGS